MARIKSAPKEKVQTTLTPKEPAAKSAKAKEIKKEKTAKKKVAQAADSSEKTKQLELEIEELKNLNNKLLLDLYRFREIQEIIQFGDFELDIKNDKWTCSPSLDSILGIDESYTKTISGWINLIHPEDRQKIIQYFTNLLSSKNQFRMEYRIIGKNNNKEKWVFENGNFDYDTYDNPVKLHGIIYDITERKNAEIRAASADEKLKLSEENLLKDLQKLKLAEADSEKRIEELKISETGLKQSEEKLKASLLQTEFINNKFLTHIQNMPIGHLEVDADLTLKNWNPRAEDIFGYTQTEVVGKNIIELLASPPSQTVFRAQWTDIDDGIANQQQTIENLTKNGNIVFCNWYNTPLKDSEGNCLGWTSLIVDISEQVNSRNKIEINEEKIKQVFNNVPLGIMHYNTKGEILDCNENLAVIFGETKAGMKMKNLFSFSETKLFESIKISLSGKTESFECNYIVESSGKIMPIRVELAPITLEDGNVIGGVGIIEDISEKKQIERIFFHDVVNTAGNLRSLVSILYENLNNQTKFKFAKLVKNLSEQLLAEIKTHRYLLASKSGDIKLEIKKINTLDFLNKQLNTFSFSGLHNKIKLQIVESSEDIEFESDLSLLSRVIGNMIKNALEAAFVDEVITIGCGLQEDMITFWVHNKAYISEAIRNQLFMRSVSTKGEGRGLGTYSMKLLTEQYLKGKIYFSTTEENGTTFIVCYPKSLR